MSLPGRTRSAWFIACVAALVVVFAGVTYAVASTASAPTPTFATACTTPTTR